MKGMWKEEEEEGGKEGVEDGGVGGGWEKRRCKGEMGSEKDAICQRLTGRAEGGKKETDAPTDFEITMMMKRMKMMARKKEESCNCQ